MTYAENLEVIGGFSNTSKIPCLSIGMPTKYCITGSRASKTPGSICEGCYGKKGNYKFPAAERAAERRHERLKHGMNGGRSRYVDAFSWLLNYELEHNTKHQDTKYFRWFDIGDIQGQDHMDIIMDIVKRTPGVKHWIPTKEVRMVMNWVLNHTVPKNAVVRISNLKIDQSMDIVRRMAKIPGLAAAGVYTETPQRYAHACSAKVCADCRICWSEKAVTYKRK